MIQFWIVIIPTLKRKKEIKWKLTFIMGNEINLILSIGPTLYLKRIKGNEGLEKKSVYIHFT